MSGTKDSRMNVKAYCRIGDDVNSVFAAVEAYLLSMSGITIDEIFLDFQQTITDQGASAVTTQLRDKINAAMVNINSDPFSPVPPPVYETQQYSPASIAMQPNAPSQSGINNPYFKKSLRNDLQVHPASAKHGVDALRAGVDARTANARGASEDARNADVRAPGNIFKSKSVAHSPPTVYTPLSPAVQNYVNNLLDYIDTHPINFPDFSAQNEKGMMKIQNYIRSALNVSISRDEAKVVANEVIRIRRMRGL